MDTEERIVLEVELEKLDKTATSRLKNSLRQSRPDACIIPSTSNIQSTRSYSLREHLRLDLNKEEAIHVDRIINKYSDLYRLPDELLEHTCNYT